MASFPKEHPYLYFDVTIRTQKKESVLAFIMATYYAKKNNSNEESVKQDIYDRLEAAYKLFRDNVGGYDNGVGSYSGTGGQFSSQYTLGLEMGIWKNSSLDLNDLALKVAKSQITITDYFDVVLLNYVQPINGKIVHPLYLILNYIKNTNGKSIDKSEFQNALGLTDNEVRGETINALYNILIGTSYFEKDNNTLTISKEHNLDSLISKCNKKYLGPDGYTKAKAELENDDEAYIEYITSQNDEIPSEEEIASEVESEEIIEDRKNRFKKWLSDSGRFRPNSIRNYSYYINYIKKHGYTEYDLYTINDISIIDNLLYKFNNNQDYITWNKDNRYTPSNALSAYKEFLIYEKGNSDKRHYIASVKDYSTNHKLYFDKHGYFYWGEGQAQKYNVGDIIYLYFSSDNGEEIQRIKKKTIVSEVHVPHSRIISEGYHGELGITDYESTDYYIKMTIIAETESDELTSKSLREKFNLTPPQLGTSEIKDDNIIKYIESCFNANVLKENKPIPPDDTNRITGAYNKIFYGVPGSGKSYKVDLEFNKNDFYIKRTTFHPEYTNSDFIGQLFPMTNNEKGVDYVFHPGAFTVALKHALEHKDEKVCLIIEEINRGNASAIFGDIFQLLDREDNKEENPSIIGKSKYTIFNEPILKFLEKEGISLSEVYIPSNMWIVATMNTSDQNVFTLDTAFKRRWKMEYIPNVFVPDKKGYTKALREAKIPRTDITWEDFVKEINKKIAQDDSTISAEDKQMGMYFVTLEEVRNEKEFAEKVLSYIWDDVAKIDVEDWFGNIKTYDELLTAYEKESIRVFNKIFDNYQIHLEENNHEQSNESNTI